MATPPRVRWAWAHLWLALHMPVGGSGWCARPEDHQQGQEDSRPHLMEASDADHRDQGWQSSMLRVPDKSVAWGDVDPLAALRAPQTTR